MLITTILSLTRSVNLKVMGPFVCFSDKQKNALKANLTAHSLLLWKMRTERIMRIWTHTEDKETTSSLHVAVYKKVLRDMNSYVDKNAWHTTDTPAAQPELERCYSHEYIHLHIPTLHIIAGVKSNITTPTHGQQNFLLISDILWMLKQFTDQDQASSSMLHCVMYCWSRLTAVTLG